MQVRDIVLITLWIFIVTVSTVGAYKIYVVDQNYQILTTTSCDPTTTSCFELESEKEEYFQYIKKLAYNTTKCDARDQECEPLQCKKGEEKCEVISCNSDTLSEYAEEGASCTDETLIIEVPVEEVEVVIPPAVEVVPTPVEVPRAPIDSNQEEIIPVAPETTPTQAPSTPVEDMPEPSHNLPI